MHLDLPLDPALAPEGLRPLLDAAVKDGWRETSPPGDERPRLHSGARLALHPDFLSVQLEFVPGEKGWQVRATFRCAPWMRAATRAAVRKRCAFLPIALPASPAAPRPGFALRSFSVFLSLLLSSCAGILVAWGFGMALLAATTQPPPDYFGVAHLADLPFFTRFWAAWFFAFSMGYPLGLLSGLLCCAAEYLRPVADGLLPLLGTLAAWIAFMTFLPETFLASPLTALALPFVCWAAYSLPWGLRQEVPA